MPHRSSAHFPGRSLLEAVRFLTAIPIPGLSFADERTIARSMAQFPVVGLGIGVLGWAVGACAYGLWGAPVHALAVVISWTLLTLGLHLDGVADSCDALFSWRTRERKLEIMRDSRIGTMGSLGLLIIVLTKIFALNSLGEGWWRACLLAPMWGRWADIYGIFWFPAAREGGLGRTFHEQVRKRDFTVATATALVFSIALAGVPGALLVGVVALSAHVVARRMVVSLGGLTGDTYGALAELAEVVVMLYLLGLAHHGMALHGDWESWMDFLRQHWPSA